MAINFGYKAANDFFFFYLTIVLFILVPALAFLACLSPMEPATPVVRLLLILSYIIRTLIGYIVLGAVN